MSDTIPTYRIIDALTQLDAALLNLDEIRRILTAPPPPPGYTLYPGQDPAVALADLAAGDTLWLADGTHPYAIHLPKAINVRAVDGARPVVSGWRSVEWEEYGGGIYRIPWDRAALGLSHHVVTNAAFLAAQDGPARMAAHNFATQPELVTYEGEPLRRVPLALLEDAGAACAYDEKLGKLWVYIGHATDPGRLQVATLPQLFTAADGVAGITAEGITFTGAANTHKQGAVELHSDGNTIDVEVDLVNSLAFSVRGIGLDARMRSIRAGQGGYWIKCQKSKLAVIHESSNWRGSDAGWHTNKFEQSIDNDIIIVSEDSNGPAAWFDVGNHNNRVKLSLYGSRKNGLLVEHFAEGNTFSGIIRDTKPLGRWAGSHVQIQSNVKGNTFDGLEIAGDLVPHWLVYKTQENRGPSGPNTFRNITTGGRPAKFEPARHEKDVFEGTE